MSSRRGDPNKLVAGAHPGFPNGAKSALMSAAESGNAAKVEQLIDDQKADVNLKNEHGLTALHFASTPEVARALCERGADKEAKAFERTWGPACATPLALAIRRDSARMIKELGSLGADLDANDADPIKRCLDANPPKMKTLTALLEAGASVDGLSGMPPLFHVVRRHNIAAVRFLCDAGANLAIRCTLVAGGPAMTALGYAMSLHKNEWTGACAAELQSRGAPLA